jgi:homoserine O-acetyltransferase
MTNMHIFECSDGIKLEASNQQFLYELAYHTYGKLNSDKSNVKWVFHALTASSDAESWWGGLFGPGRILDPTKDFIVCANMLGSCYGSTGPLSANPKSRSKYYHDFPFLTTRDIVNSLKNLKNHLGIEKINMGIGGSMGGSILLEWNVMYPEDFKNSVLVATSAAESSWGKAIHTVHRMAIETDPSWTTKEDNAGIQGLKTARGVGMLFYRTYQTFNQFQVDNIDDINNYKSESYIRYQGEKLINRFNAFSYYNLLNLLDTHNVGRKRGSIEDALSSVQSRSLIIGIKSDILYPNDEQFFLYENIPESNLEFIKSEYGHDGFLIETEKINKIASDFMNK